MPKPVDLKKSPLTVKERKLVKGIAEGKPKYVAAMEAYDVEKPTTAATIASQTLRKVNVQEALAEAFAKHGITIDAATKPIADGLKATKLDIETGDGEIKGVLSAPDHSIRLKAASLAFNLMGVTRGEGSGNVTFISVVNDHSKKYGI